MDNNKRNNQPVSIMEWISITEALPKQFKRVLAWTNHPIFGEYSIGTGWSFDFVPSIDLEVTHFCHIQSPDKDADWTPFQDFLAMPDEEVILWCGTQAVCGYWSSDVDDPERDSDGWVYDIRWRGMTKPSHAMRINQPE